MKLKNLVLTLGLMVFCHGTGAGEIFPFKDPKTGSETYTLKQGQTVVRFSPSNGANVFWIQIAGIEYLKPPPDMHDFLGLAYGTPVLYPTPNRVRDARFLFAGKSYAFKPNLPPDHIHGLVFDEDWDVVETETTKDRAVVRVALDFRSGTRLFNKYPFTHRIILAVVVMDGAVRWSYEVDNTEGTGPVPFGFGLHPYFKYQGAREHTWVTLPATHKMEAVEFFPTGRLIAANELDFALGQPVSLDGRNFDDVFLGLRASEQTTIDFRDKQRRVTMSASDAFSHVVLYSPDADFFSVEHQTSSTDAHNLHAAGLIEQASLQICPPGETRSGWVEYRFPLVGDVEWILDDEGFKLSQEHCASCHGFAFTGARTKDLWNGGWQYATSPADISAVIAKGIPDAGMPAFDDVLDDAQIESLTTIMVELLQKYPRDMTDTALEVSHDEPRQSYRETFRLQTVVDGLKVPWSFTFLPDGAILLTERVGNLRLVQNGTLSIPVSGTPVTHARQDGGLLSLALDPHFADNGWVYLSYADPGIDEGTSMTKIVRGRIANHAWVDEQTIWQAPAATYTESNVHFGSRLLLDDDYVFFSVGDRGERQKAQDLSSPLGKVHRVHRDGSIPNDNPFRDRPGAYASVWSYGHRNPQGLARAPDGALWSTEHGPTGGDELNRIEPGQNYGWPLATQGTEMDGSPISAQSSIPGMADPVYVWPETIAPSNLSFYEGEPFSGWHGDLFVASMASEELRRIEIRNEKLATQELLLSRIGRIRDVQVGPDGMVYLAVERYGGQGAIVKLVPATIAAPPLDTGNFEPD